MYLCTLTSFLPCCFLFFSSFSLSTDRHNLTSVEAHLDRTGLESIVFSDTRAVILSSCIHKKSVCWSTYSSWSIGWVPPDHRQRQVQDPPVWKEDAERDVSGICTTSERDLVRWLTASGLHRFARIGSKEAYPYCKQWRIYGEKSISFKEKQR